MTDFEVLLGKMPLPEPQFLSGFLNFVAGDGVWMMKSAAADPPTSEENVAALRAIVEDDARVTVAQLEEEVGISSGAIRMILHSKLLLSKISARWMPHQLTPAQ